MNYAGFQSQFDLFVDGLHFKQFGLMLFSNLTTTKICSLYCLLLIITWQLNGSECGTGKSSLSIQYPGAVNSFQKRLFTVVTIVTKEQSRFVVLNHQFCLVLFKQWIYGGGWAKYWQWQFRHIKNEIKTKNQMTWHKAKVKWKTCQLI